MYYNLFNKICKILVFLILITKVVSYSFLKIHFNQKTKRYERNKYLKAQALAIFLLTEEDPILRIINSNYFSAHPLYFRSLKINFPDEVYISYNCPITEHSQKEQQLAIKTYQDYPEYFKYLIQGKLRSNILQELFYPYGLATTKNVETFLKASLEIQTILNLPTDLTYKELQTNHPQEYKRTKLLRKNLKYLLTEHWTKIEKNKGETNKKN